MKTIRHFRALLLAGVLLLLAGCGMSAEERANLRATNAASGVGGSGERFNVVISGTVELTLVPGFAFIQQLQELDAYQLLLSDGATEYRINFTIPLDLAAGASYPVYGDAEADVSGAVGVGVAGPRREFANFNVRAEGRFTLESAGDRFAGSFDVTLFNVQGEQVRVVGSFADVPLVNR